MSGPTRGDGGTLLPQLTQQVDEACDRFEAAWKGGQRPSIEEYLGTVPEAGRAELLRHLLALELAYRRRPGEHPTVDEYQARFPDTKRTAADVRPPDGQRGTACPKSRCPTVSGYEILREVGRGGMGVVYEARQLRLNRIVALKMILEGHCAAEAVLRFLSEAKAIAQLHHPNIVQVYSIGDADGNPFLELEFIEGGSLAERLDGTPRAPRKAAWLVEAIALAIVEAHRRGVIHRDLKPSNILLMVDGTPKVADFGLAKMLGTDSGMTRSDVVLGSPSYMAPEQAEGRTRESGPAADLYALGAILYELLTGRPPFKGATVLETLEQVRRADPVPPSRLVPDLPRDVETIALKCLQKEPSKRYESAKALADDLERFIERRPIRARRISPAERAWRWCRRNPALASSIASVTLLLLLFAAASSAAAYIWRLERDKARAAEAAATTQLRETYLAQARAARRSGLAGQRFDSLQALAKAAAIRPGPDLRDEAIACSTLVDLRVASEWEADLPDESWPAADVRYERHVRGDPRGKLTLRRMADDQILAELPGFGVVATWKRFSPDGRFLAVFYRNNQFRVWDVDRRVPIPGLPSVVRHHCADFSPDGRQLAVHREDRSVAVYALPDGREQARLAPTRSTPSRLRFHPDGRRIAFVAEGSKIEVYDLEAGTYGTPVASPAPVYAFEWGTGGSLLAAACTDDRIYTWEGPPYRRRATLIGHHSQPTDLAFGHVGDLLASGGWDDWVRLWDPRTGKLLMSMSGELRGAFSPDDRKLIGNTPNLARHLVWDVAASAEYRVLRGRGAPDHGSWFVDTSPDARLVAAAGPDGVRLWALDTGAEVAHLPVGLAGGAAFRPDGSGLATYSEAGLRLWPIRAEAAGPPGGLLIGPPRVLGRVESDEVMGSLKARWTAGGRTLAVTEPRRDRVVILDPADPSRREVLQYKGGLSGVMVSPDGRWVVTTPWHGEAIKVWDVRTRAPAWELRVDRGNVAFSPDGRWLVTATAKGFYFWEVGTWRPGRRIERDVSALSLGFAPDGSTLAITPEYGVVELLDPQTGRTLARLEAPDLRAIDSLCFTPDGSRLAVGAHGLGVQLWVFGLIRRRLAAMGLDWDQPPLKPREITPPGPVRVVDPAVSSGRGSRRSSTGRTGRWPESRPTA